MLFIHELHAGFDRFSTIIHEGGHDDILSIPYAEYSLQCFVIYQDALYGDILHRDGTLAKALCSISIDQPRDQLTLFLDALYLFLHAREKRQN